MENYLQKAVTLLHGQPALAAAINTFKDNEKLPSIKQPHIWRWLNTNPYGITAEYVIACAKATGWQVTPHQLRPDLYKHPHDGLPEHLRSAA